MLDRVSSIRSVFIEDDKKQVKFQRSPGQYLNLLEHIEYRFCDSGEDLEAIYRLRYKSYRTHGLVSRLIASI